ncbi:MAG: SIR2 family protein, partial [Acidimicrobiales bacterium]
KEPSSWFGFAALATVILPGQEGSFADADTTESEAGRIFEVKHWEKLVKDPARLDRDRKVLNRLAKRLQQNHLRRSLPPEQRPLLHQARHLEPKRRDSRVIAVVGAGASYPLLRLAQQLAEEFIEQHEGDSQAYRAELHRQIWTNNLDGDSFETKLTAFARTTHGERRARIELAKYHAFRHPALLNYELIAHLVKHRYVDAVISFNFDELLDQSIEDELTTGEFIRVVTESDLVGITSYPGFDDYIPIYLKLHGTASDPSSLRFTRDSYYALPQGFRDLVENILGYGHCTIVNMGFQMRSFDFTQSLTGPASLEIFNLGHDALTIDALMEIEEARTGERRREEAPRSGGEFKRGGTSERTCAPASGSKRGRAQTSTAAPSGWREQMRDNAISATAKRRQRKTALSFQFYNVVNCAWKPKRDTSRFPRQDKSNLQCLDLQLLALCTLIGDLHRANPNNPITLEGLAYFRDISRHRAVCELLGVPELVDRSRPIGQLKLLHYLQGRLALEMAFINATSRGLTTLEVLRNGRCGRYFDLSQTLAPMLEGHRDLCVSWSEALRMGGFVESLRSSTTMVADAAICDPGGKPNYQRVGSEGINWSEQLCILNVEKLANRAMDWISYGWRGSRDQSLVNAERTKLAGVLRNLTKGTEVEIHSRDDRICRSQFIAPETLPTMTALRTRTSILLQSRPLHGLDVVAESAEWLTTDAGSEIRKSIESSNDDNVHFQLRVVVAFADWVEGLMLAFDGHLEVKQLPWWRHNRHMTIARRAEEDWTLMSNLNSDNPRIHRFKESRGNSDRLPVEATYFARRGRALNVTPVYLPETGDAQRLAKDFERLWMEASPIDP